MKYELETGIHYVFLTVSGILGLSTLSTSSQSSHVAEFSNGVLKAVPRRGNGGGCRHTNSTRYTIMNRHTNSNVKAADDLQAADAAILSVHFSKDMEMDKNVENEATILLIDDSIIATGRILGSSQQQSLKSHEQFGTSLSSATLGIISCFSAALATQIVDEECDDGESHSSATCEKILSNQQATFSPACLDADVPTCVHKEADLSMNSMSNTESIGEQITILDNLGAVYSTKRCPEKAHSLHVRTDLVLEDDISPSTTSNPHSSSDNGANTPLTPATSTTSPILSLPLDLPKIHVPQEQASTTISALDLEEKTSISERWKCVHLQWLDLAISDRQYGLWEELQETEELEYALEDQTMDMFPCLSSPEEVDKPIQLEDLDLDTMFGQLATDLDDEPLPQEAIHLQDVAVVDDDVVAVETLNDYNPEDREIHHLNLLRYPVYQASRTPSALSLWVTMASTKKVQIADHVSLKAVVSSQAAKWIDPVLLEADASVPEEVTQNGNATAYRNFLTGLTTIQYEPYGIWQSETYDYEQDIPCVVDSDAKEDLDAAYTASYGFPGLQRPYLVDEHDGSSCSFPSAQMKELKGWECLERRGNSNLRFVLDEDSITRWHAPAATSTSYEVAEPTDLQEDENDNAEIGLAIPAEGSELEDRPGPCGADDDSQDASSLRSLLAFSAVAREAMSPPNEGRFFTPGVREESEEDENLSHNIDGESWDTDENGAFVSPKKGQVRLRGEMSGDISSNTTLANGDFLDSSEISIVQLTSPEAQGEVAPAFTICYHEVVDMPPTGVFRNSEP